MMRMFGPKSASRTGPFPGISIVLMAAALAAGAQEQTRGIGVYPGNPKEYAGPSLRIDATTYRNLALRRPVYQSSAYDYNLTAQLVADGVKETRLPRWVAASSSLGGAFAKNEREWLLDDNSVTGPDLKGPGAWVEVELGGGESPLVIDRLDLDARSERGGWTAVVSGSGDGLTWTELGRAVGVNTAGKRYEPSWTSVPFTAPSRARHYRVAIEGAGAGPWHVANLKFLSAGGRVRVGGPFDFASAWKSAGAGEEWVYVDLGAAGTFDRVALTWIRRAAEGAVQVSDDAGTWTTIQALGPEDDIRLKVPARGRYVRVLMTKPESPEGYILGELEVFGRGGLVPIPKAAPPARADGRLDLTGGGWRLQRDSLVAADGPALSKPGVADGDWVAATVPATTLVSYLNAGALPDPNFGDNITLISDSFFYADFWYRNEFAAPAPRPGRRTWLNFDGVNWKAEVYLNGEKVGRIDGGFLRGRFDVTDRLRAGERNALAVRVEKVANPGSVKEKTYRDPDKNGGILGADNPTYHASIGWDWIPTVRGRNTGLWNDVYLTTTGDVTIEDPLVTTKLSGSGPVVAEVAVEAVLKNHGWSTAKGVLRGRFGAVAFETAVMIEAGAEKTVRIDPGVQPALRIENPKLWWPAGYGEPSLYSVELRFETGKEKVEVSDAKSFQAGIREFRYSEEGGALRLWINGRRFIARGGNWGFGESMLRYRGREYDAAVRYHRDMNFTMIRNWVGQIGDDELYEACDRHGIVVWQDFWLANPWDGPDPDDPEMFLKNARDMVLRIRRHPSIGLYCGRNEGSPPAVLNDGLRAAVAELHPGLHYIPDSAADVVSGHGPYRAMAPSFYFKERATEKLHSELGMPNIPTFDSVRAMMPAAALWPQGDIWGTHDFSLRGAQGGQSYIERIQKSYGGGANTAEWTALAQFVNYEGYRAMFEAQGKNRMGLLIWMSHPCWPSFVWQTYDYFLEPTAAYFGAKKASEPLHIQWNPADETVEVVNYSAGDARELDATAELVNPDGEVKWKKTARLEAAEDGVQAPIKMEYPDGLAAVHFVRLKLERAGAVVSENLYWRGTEDGNYRALAELPATKVHVETRIEKLGARWKLMTELFNAAATPALLVRVKPVREKTGDRILPAIISDNFLILLPGDRRTVIVDLADADARGEKPRIEVEQFR